MTDSEDELDRPSQNEWEIQEEQLYIEEKQKWRETLLRQKADFDEEEELGGTVPPDVKERH